MGKYRIGNIIIDDPNITSSVEAREYLATLPVTKGLAANVGVGQSVASAVGNQDFEQRPPVVSIDPRFQQQLPVVPSSSKINRSPAEIADLMNKTGIRPDSKAYPFFGGEGHEFPSDVKSNLPALKIGGVSPDAATDIDTSSLAPQQQQQLPYIQAGAPGGNPLMAALAGMPNRVGAYEKQTQGPAMDPARSIELSGQVGISTEQAQDAMMRGAQMQQQGIQDAAGMAAQMQQQAAAAGEREAQYRKEMAPFQAEVDKYQQFLAQGIDPDRALKQMPTVSKGLFLLGTALGGFVEGFTKGAVKNKVPGMIDAMINRDIMAQRENYQRRLAQLNFSKDQRNYFMNLAERELGRKAELTKAAAFYKLQQVNAATKAQQMQAEGAQLGAAGAATQANIEAMGTRKVTESYKSATNTAKYAAMAKAIQSTNLKPPEKKQFYDTYEKTRGGQETIQQLSELKRSLTGDWWKDADTVARVKGILVSGVNLGKFTEKDMQLKQGALMGLDAAGWMDLFNKWGSSFTSKKGLLDRLIARTGDNNKIHMGELISVTNNLRNAYGDSSDTRFLTSQTNNIIHRYNTAGRK